jgi:hypothetical protein
MRDRWIAKAIVCLVILVAASARAQDSATALAPSAPRERDASASVELSLSVSPSALMALAAVQLGGSSTGGLGGLPLFTPRLDLGIYVDRSVVLTVGVSGSYRDAPQSAYSVSVPLSVLWYLETPRVGAVMPTFRLGVGLSYSHLVLPPGVGAPVDALSGSLTAYGGITWLAARNLALRAEVGGMGSLGWSAEPGGPAISGALGLAAQLAVVLRV